MVTKRGRVETTNYRTVKLPNGMDIPVFCKNEFWRFYKSMFDTQVKKEDMRAVLQNILGYVVCDPCAADPMSSEELRSLVFLVTGAGRSENENESVNGGFPRLK